MILYFSTDNYTILLPNENAFNNLKTSILEDIKREPDRIGALIRGHIIPKTLFSYNLTHERMEATLLGDRVQFVIDGPKIISVNGSKIVEKDILAKNGVIHVIDDVIASDSIKKVNYLN